MLQSKVVSIYTRAFSEAVKNSDIDIVKCLAKYIDIKRTVDDNYLIFHAVKNNNIDMLKFLTEQGCDVNCIYSGNISLLQYAVKKNNKEIIKLLLKKGADTSYRDSQNRGLLWYILKYGNDNRILDMAAEDIKNLLPDEFLDIIDKVKEDKVIEKFVKKLNINYADERGTPLIWLIQRKLSSEIIKNLVHRMVPSYIDVADKHGKSALYYVLKQYYDKNIVKIIMKSSSQKRKNETLLMMVKEQDEYGVNELISYGADLNYVEKPNNKNSVSVISAALNSLLSSYYKKDASLDKDAAINILDMLLKHNVKYIDNIESLLRRCPMEIQTKLKEKWDIKILSAVSLPQKTIVQGKNSIGGWGTWDVFRFSPFYMGKNKKF